MKLEELFKTICDDLEREAMRKFDSKKEFIRWQQEQYQKHGYKSLGLRVPEIEKIGEKYIKQFKDLSLEDRFSLSREFYQSEYIALTNFGLKLLQVSIPELTPQHFDFLDEILGYISHWGPTDSFSLYVMQPMLRAYPTETKHFLKSWNTSDSLWKKRTSVVTFARKIGEEGEYVDFLLELCDNLIWDTEDLVRKGVGWALKDNIIGKNRKKILDYVKKLRKMGVSSTITLYAIRKIKGKEREAILSIKASK